MKKVDAYLLPGASSVFKFKDFKNTKTLKNNEVLLSKKFFEESGLKVPKNAKKIKMATYAYYPKSAIGKRSNRGSGRGHILLDQPNAKDIIEFKGSGTNKHYSSANSSAFNPGDYRRNGLAVIDELTTEMIMGRIFQKNGVPISMSFEMKLMPDAIQEVSRGLKGNSKSAVQVSRKMNMGRESMYPGLSASQEEKMKLIGRMYAVNGQLGAINTENMTFGAKLLDLGHTNVGYPMVSGSYRCTLCKGMEGGSADKTLIGFFDHYFENIPSYTAFVKGNRHYIKQMKLFSKVEKAIYNNSEIITSQSWARYAKKLKVKLTFDDYSNQYNVNNFKSAFNDFKSFNRTKLENLSDKQMYKAFVDERFRIHSRSYNFKLDNNTAVDFISELTTNLGKPLKVKLDQNEIEALREILRETVRIDRSWDDVLKYGEAVTGLKLPSDVRPERMSFSIKSIMQYAGLKKFLSPKEYLELRSSLRDIVSERSIKTLDDSIDMFENIYKSKNLTQSDLKQLYVEYHPANVIEDKVREVLDLTTTNNELIKATNNLVDNLSKPIVIDPRKYFEETVNLSKLDSGY